MKRIQVTVSDYELCTQRATPDVVLRIKLIQAIEDAGEHVPLGCKINLWMPEAEFFKMVNAKETFRHYDTSKRQTTYILTLTP